MIVDDGTPFANHGTLVVETTGNDLAHNWRNTIEVAWASGSPPVYTDPMVAAFVGMLKGGQRDDCHISKVTLFPYVKGRQPLASQGAIWEQIVSIPCSNFGTGTVYPSAPNSGPTPLGEVSLLITKPKFSGGGGRVGRMFIRNALGADNISSDAGGPPHLVPPNDVNLPADWNVWLANTLGPFTEDNPLPRFVLIHAQKLTQSPPAHDIFDTAMGHPIFTRVTMHDLTSKNKK